MGEVLLFVVLASTWGTFLQIAEGYLFQEYVVRARCQARCNGEYGMQQRHHASDFFDVYPSYACNDTHYNCVQCSAPCYGNHSDLTVCKSMCGSDACNASCDFFYKSKKEEYERKKSDLQARGRNLYLAKPVITCTYSKKGRKPDNHMVFLRWNVRDRGSNVSTSTPLCFIVSRQEDHGIVEDWVILGKTNFSFIPATRLRENRRYRFNVTAVSQDGPVDVTKTTTWALMPEAPSTPQAPTEVKVVKQEVRNSKVVALVTWKPGHKGGCFFKLYWMGDGDMKDSFQARDVTEWPQFKYELPSLMFGRNYNVQVHTYDKGYKVSSRPATVLFKTLTCLENTNYNYTICEPDEPRNLSTTIGPTFTDGARRRVANVTLSWLPPKHASRHNVINKFVVSWHKKPPLPYSDQIEADHGETRLPGIQTSLVLLALHMDSRYAITVTAVSKGGETPATTVAELGIPYKDILEAAEEGVTPDINGNHSTYRQPLSSVDKNVYILALLPACIACIAALIFYLYRKYFRSKMTKRELACVAKQELNPLYGSVSNINGGGCHDEIQSLLPVDDFEVDVTRLHFLQTLGEGAFGKVLKAELEPPGRNRECTEKRTVAVKMLKDHPLPEERRSLLLEIDVMKQFGRHQNVVSMIGCCTTGPRICLIMDYCPFGDLRNYLRDYREKHLSNMSQLPLNSFVRDTKDGKPVNYDSGISQHSSQGQEYGANSSRESRATFASSLPSGDEDVFLEEDTYISQSTLLSYARQIALGMDYLSQKKFVHRDLATRNVLVHSHRLLKISDFGLSRDVYETNMYQPTSARKLPYKWMPLESIFDNRFTTQSDVWSFGIVLWEIVTLGGCPYPGIPNKDLFHLLREGYRMEKPDNCSTEIYQLMLSCWHPHPEDRPCFTEIRYKLEVLLEATRSYIDLSVNVSPDYYTHDSSDEHEARKEPGVSRSDNVYVYGEKCQNAQRCSEELDKSPREEDVCCRSEPTPEHYKDCNGVVAEETLKINKVCNSANSESGTDCSFQSDGNVTSEQEVMSEYDLEPESDCSTRSLDRKDNSHTVLKALSLRNGMVSVLGQIVRRGQAERLKKHKHSLSMSEMYNAKENSADPCLTSAGSLAL